jgi:hypothetical protein
MAVQSELLPGETVAWAGQPDPGVIFHKQDALLIPFSLMWGGFAIFWEAGVVGLWGHTRAWSFGMLWGIPFVLAGQYIIWGRFLYAGWLKRRTNYAVTNRRVLVVQNGWNRQVSSAYIDSLPTIIKEVRSNGVGTLAFAESQGVWSKRGGGSWNAFTVGGIPTFIDVSEVDSIYRLIFDLREKARTGKASF